MASSTVGSLDDLGVDYEVTEIKWKPLFNWCLEKEVSKWERWADVRPRPIEDKSEAENIAELWKADTVYLCLQNDLNTNWVMTKGNYIFSIWTDWDLSDEQKSTLLERLVI